MSPANNLEQRLTELEIKLSFQEDLIDKLEMVIFGHQRQIDSLLREIGHLQRQLPASDSLRANSPRDELPPHY